MGIYTTPLEKVNEYYENPAISQSKLKLLLKGLDYFLSNQSSEKELYYEEKDHFIIGSAVDTLLTGENGDFEKQYYVSEAEKPGDSILSVIHEVFDLLLDYYNYQQTGMTIPSSMTLAQFVDQDLGMKAYPEYMLASANAQNYCAKMKDETRIERLMAYNDYFLDLCNAHGKQVLSPEQNEKVKEIVRSLRSHPRTAKYFDRDMQEQRGDSIDFYYQLPIYFKHNGVECKALLDLVLVFKEGDEIVAVQPVDLKTMNGYTINFHSNLKRFRYDIQAAFYTLALTHYFKVPELLVKPFIFVVESTTNVGKPLVYELDKSLLESGKTGIDYSFTMSDFDIVVKPFKDVLGFEQLMEDYLWYEKHGWEEDRRIPESGNLKIDWNGII